MKKALALITSAALALSMASSFAFIIGPAGTDTSQMSIKSVKAVDIPVGVEGVRSYADIVDTARIYQANEIINIATVLEVKNRAFEPTLATIDGKDIVLSVTSTTADLAYGNYAPAVISAVQTATTNDPRNVLTFSERIPTQALTYTSATNTIDVKMKGSTVQTSVGSGVGINYGISMNYLQDYKASIKDDKVSIPALEVANYNMGTYTLQAPRALEYTIVTTGLTKEGTSGNMEAKIRISGAEAFSTVGYIPQVTTGGVVTGPSAGAPFNKISKLEIKNNYVIFKFDAVAFAPMGTVRGTIPSDYSAATNPFIEWKKAQVAAPIEIGSVDGQTADASKIDLTSKTKTDGNYRDPYSFAVNGEPANIVAYMIFKYDANAADVDFSTSLKKAETDPVAAAGNVGKVGDFVMTLYTEESNNPAYLSSKSLAITSFLEAGSSAADMIIDTAAAKAVFNFCNTISAAGGVNATQIYSNSGNYNTAALTLNSGAQGAMKAAASFFGIDATLGWGAAVKNAQFEAKGAPAVYSDVVNGTYNYGTITIIEEVVEESTEEVEEDLEDEEVVEDEEIVEDEEAPAEEEEVVVVVPTGDFSSNVAIALVASAIVAAAALVFVTKKAR